MRAVLLPIISYPEDSIEARAKQASQKIPEVIWKKEWKKKRIYELKYEM